MPGPGRPFVKGSVPNPKGRPVGSRSRATLAIEALFEGEAEAISRRVIAKAKRGDPVAIKICMDRILAPRKDRITPFPLPSLDSPADLPNATAALVRAVSEGDLTPGEASDIAKIFDLHIHAVEVADHERRIAEIEARNEQQDGDQDRES